MEEDESLAKPRRGRPKGSLNKRSIFAREWAEKLGLQDPAEFLIRVMNSDTVEVTKADADGNAVLGADERAGEATGGCPLGHSHPMCFRTDVFRVPASFQPSKFRRAWTRRLKWTWTSTHC